MLKVVVAATAAVTIAGSTVAFAQPQGRSDGNRRWRPTTEDIQAFQAARLAALRAGLALSADQEKYWPAFEQAVRDLQQLRLSRVAALRDARRSDSPRVLDPAERMRQRATRLSENGAVLKRLAEATDPLYQSLDEAQRRRFGILSRTDRLPRWRSHDADEQRPQRRFRRKDAAIGGPDESAPIFSRKIVNGDLFAQAFVAKTLEGVLVGRVFGAKTVNGELAIGELATASAKSPFSGKVPEGPVVGGDLAAIDRGLVGHKQVTSPGANFGRKVTIGEPPAFGRKMVTDI